ncbi:hypothetical protein SS50377_21149 [Spironucleus salmonicida]|uniref:Uncharacterized protein n=1 Tax=Spironucleus salmonicida TaxID=348837 RepID=V6LJN8_9EUKA|nr:hypothetical protein SS50377_21149 [Spironucleus salmonicida]|eukprot:EST43931.1 Hypothetical protein SS50377_16233 [Spironucleus salmonicida]
MDQYFKSNEQLRQIFITKQLLEAIPLDSNKLIKQLEKIVDSPISMFNKIREQLTFIAYYGQNKQLQQSAARIMQNYPQPILVKLYISNILNIIPEQQITTNVNLVLINPKTPVKYLSELPIIETNVAGKFISLGWEIDEIVMFNHNHIPNWQFWNIQLQGSGKLGFPCQFNGLASYDIIQSTILDKYIPYMCYSGGFLNCQMALQFTLDVLGMQSITDLYECYIEYFITSNPVENYILGAMHCLIQISDNNFIDEYLIILTLLTKRLNMEAMVGIDKSFELNIIFSSILQFDQNKIKFDKNLVFKFYNIDDTLKYLAKDLSNQNFPNFNIIAKNICSDGRLQTLYQFFNIIVNNYSGKDIIYDNLQSTFEDIQNLFIKSNFKLIYTTMIQPLISHVDKIIDGTQFKEVKKLKHFKQNLDLELNIKTNPNNLITLFSILTIVLQSTHNRTNDMIQWFQEYILPIKIELCTFLSKVSLISKKFRYQVEKKLQNHEFYSQIITLIESLDLSINSLITTILETEFQYQTDYKYQYYTICNLNDNLFETFLFYQEQISNQKINPSSCVEIAACFCQLYDNDILLQKFLNCKIDQNSRLHQAAILRVYRFTQNQDVINLFKDTFTDPQFLQFKEFMLKKQDRQCIEEQVETFCSKIPKKEEDIVKQVMKLASQLNFNIDSHLLSGVFLIESLNNVQNYLKYPSSFNIFNKILQSNISEFQQGIIEQISDIFDENEKIACLSTVKQEYVSQIKTIFNV